MGMDRVIGRVPAIGSPALLVGLTGVGVGCLVLAMAPAALATATTQTVITAPGGAALDSGSVDPIITPDGRYLVFRSRSSNLLPVTVAPFTTANILSPSPLQPAGEDLDLGNEFHDDVFVQDRQTGAVTIVSVSSSSTGGGMDSGRGAATPDGRFVVFDSLSHDLTALTSGSGLYGGRQVFRKDTATGATIAISQTPSGGRAQGGSEHPQVSADGSVVAFQSSATDLVAGDTNGKVDIFVRDLTSGVTTRVSEGAGGVQADNSSAGPYVSGDGRFVFFSSSATNLVPGDTNGVQDVFAFDRTAGTIARIPVAGAGNQALADVYLASISPDGRYLLVESAATNLSTGGPATTGFQVHLHDQATGTTTLVSLGNGGVAPTGSAGSSDLSADGRFVSFQSGSTNLVAGDTNGRDDIFVRDVRMGTTQRMSVDPDGSQREGTSWNATITADGRSVFYIFQATGSGVFDIQEAPTRIAGPIVVLPENEYTPLMNDLAEQIPELAVALSYPNVYPPPAPPTQMTVGACTSPLPAGHADSLDALRQNAYTSVGGTAAGPLTPWCSPDAVAAGVPPN